MLHTAGAAPQARVSAAEGCRRSGSHCVHSPTFQTVAHRKNFLSKHKGLGQGDCRMFHKCLPLPEAAWVSDLKVSHLYSDCIYIIKRITLYILCFKTQSTCTVSVSLLSCDWERKKSKSRHASWSHQIWWQDRSKKTSVNTTKKHSGKDWNLTTQSISRGASLPSRCPECQETGVWGSSQ